MKAPTPLTGKKVLVVDDEAELRKAMIFDLKRRGCEVFEAGCGNEAFEIVKSREIDIVLSDIRMPNGNGIELLKQIRSLNPASPVLLLISGYSDLTEEEALRLGAQGLFEKPIDRKRMYSLLEQAFT